jgi:DivIVA domain-containing protein
VLELRPAFDRRLNGYDRAQVDAYVAEVRRLLEEVRDHTGPADEVGPAELAQAMRRQADALLESARRRSTELVENAIDLARSQAEQIVEQAALRAEVVLEQVEDMTRRLRDEPLSVGPGQAA